MKKYLYVLLILFSFNALAEPTGKFTLRVVDQDSNPVANANAGVLFFNNAPGPGTKTNRIRGITDDNGLFAAKASTQPLIRYSASKEGYYTSGYSFDDFTGVTGFIGFRKWQPWNPALEVVLKKKINPIPMYAVNLQPVEIPLLNREVGFDLMVKDWVVPYGKGTNRDFLFKLIKRKTEYDDYDVSLHITFSNPGDGIQEVFVIPRSGSALRLDHHAPITNYIDQYEVNYKRKRGIYYSNAQLKPKEDLNFYYRVRTVLDDSGNVTSALYGKIHGAIYVDNFITKSPTATVTFNYYLNPNVNDTNIEFNPEKNLFRNLNEKEKVYKP